jgi:hypothetical protein
MLGVRAGRAFDGERVVPGGALVLLDEGRIVGVERRAGAGWLRGAGGARRHGIAGAGRHARPLVRRRHGRNPGPDRGPDEDGHGGRHRGEPAAPPGGGGNDRP